MKRRLKAIELFAGAGGMCLGLQQAGFDVIAAVEIDKWCCDTLRANKTHAFPKMKIIQADIIKISGKWLLNKVGLMKGQLDVLSGGPPCQGFTYVNSKRCPEDPRSRLMWQFLRLVNEMQPHYFVIENVRGLLSFKDFFILLLTHLEDYGYVVRFNLMDACSYGVPQHRERVFIEGCRKDLNKLPEYPPPIRFGKEKKKSFVPAWMMAIECFAKNGFTKEEVKDVWFNTMLHILMNRKTAPAVIEQAERKLILKTLMNMAKDKKRRKRYSGN